MITCPNCKFQQPKDLFCAKCGIDLNVPQNRSFMQKITESTSFYVILLCCVVLTTTFFVYKKVLVHLEKESDISSDLGYTPLDKLPPPNENEGSQQLNISSKTIQPPDWLSQNTFTSTETSGENKTENKEGIPLEDSPKIEAFSSGVIKVYFLAMPNDITSLQTAELQSGQYGIISDFAESFRSIPSENKSILSQSSWQVPPLTSPQNREFFIRSAEDDTFGQIGISIDVTVNEISEASTTLQSNIDIALLEGTETDNRRIEDSQAFDPINLNRGNAIFIFSLLPHRPPSDIERNLFPTSLSSIMESQSFLDGLTEFFVIIEYSL